MRARKCYPSDVSDAEWAFVAPHLTLMTEEARQRDHSLRDVFDGLRYLVRTGSPWRYLPGDYPPWHTVYQQTQRWIKAGSFDAIVQDLRSLLRLAERTRRDRLVRMSAISASSLPLLEVIVVLGASSSQLLPGRRSRSSRKISPSAVMRSNAASMRKIRLTISLPTPEKLSGIVPREGRVSASTAVFTWDIRSPPFTIP